MSEFWYNENNIPSFKKLDSNLDTDVLVVGGGICGILCAYRLHKQGLKVVLVEKNKIGMQRTKNSTAVATALQDLLYFDTIKKIGIDEAKAYIDLSHKAIIEYEILSKEFSFDFEKLSSYKYFNDNEVLNKEIFAIKSLGYKPKKLEKIPYIDGIAGAIELQNQAQFNPLKLIYSLSKELQIYEDTEIVKVEPNLAFTKNNNFIFAKNIIITTGYPLYRLKGLFALKLTQKKSYVAAIRNDNQNIAINAIGDNEKDIYYRTYKDFLLIGGNDLKTGEFNEGFKPVYSFIENNFPNSEIIYKWINQDTVSLDGLPYIGKYKRNIYIATGFNLWGMTNSMISAMLISDMILKRRNRYKNFFIINRKMVKKTLLINIKNAVINLFKFGKKRCNHLGCSLKYNSEEKTYECPCHGSKYDENLNSIYNPGKDNNKTKKF